MSETTQRNDSTDTKLHASGSVELDSDVVDDLLFGSDDTTTDDSNDSNDDADTEELKERFKRLEEILHEQRKNGNDEAAQMTLDKLKDISDELHGD